MPPAGRAHPRIVHKECSSSYATPVVRRMGGGYQPASTSSGGTAATVTSSSRWCVPALLRPVCNFGGVVRSRSLGLILSAQIVRTYSRYFRSLSGCSFLRKACAPVSRICQFAPLQSQPPTHCRPFFSSAAARPNGPARSDWNGEAFVWRLWYVARNLKDSGTVLLFAILG